MVEGPHGSSLSKHMIGKYWLYIQGSGYGLKIFHSDLVCKKEISPLSK